MSSEHREHPFIWYGEAVLVVILLCGGTVWILWHVFVPATWFTTPLHHPPTVTAPLKTGDVLQGEEVWRIAPHLEMKTGRTQSFRTVLPYDGAGPDSASYVPLEQK